jgi:hypothetical protein
MSRGAVLTGLYLLLPYRCDMKCNRWFVWGSHRTKSTMPLQEV